MLANTAIKALPLIYETATNPGRWRRALDSVCDVSGAGAIALLIRQPGSKSRDKQMLSSAYLNFTKTPSGIYYGLWLSRLQNPDWDFLSQQACQRLVHDTEIDPVLTSLDKRADYALLRKKVGVGRRLGVKLNNDRLWFDATSFAFPKSIDQVPYQATEVVQSLLPHLTKAVELGRAFSILKARYRAVLTALDHVKVGLAVALPCGELIVKNDEINRLIRLDDGLRNASDGCLQATNPDVSSAIKNAINAAANTARGEGNVAEKLFVVKRRSSDQPFLIEVAPLNDSDKEIETSLNGALITVVDPEAVPHVDMKRFIALYGLTQAEAEVCDLMLKGHTTEEISEIRNTSPITAKNQISVVLSKSGVTRRTELIRLVMRILPPIE